MHVTCNMFLMHCFGFSESYNDFSFIKFTFLKQKSLKLQKRAVLVGRGDGWLSFALHIGLGSMCVPLLHYEAVLEASFYISNANWFLYHIHLYFLFLC